MVLDRKSGQTAGERLPAKSVTGGEALPQLFLFESRLCWRYDDTALFGMGEDHAACNGLQDTGDGYLYRHIHVLPSVFDHNHRAIEQPDRAHKSRLRLRPCGR